MTVHNDATICHLWWISCQHYITPVQFGGHLDQKWLTRADKARPLLALWPSGNEISNWGDVTVIHPTVLRTKQGPTRTVKWSFMTNEWILVVCFDWLTGASHEVFLQVSDTASHVYLNHPSDYGSFKVHYAHTLRQVRVMTHLSYCDTWKREENQACRMKASTWHWCSCDTDALVRQDTATGGGIKTNSQEPGACVAKLLHYAWCCLGQSYTEQKDKTPRKKRMKYQIILQKCCSQGPVTRWNLL